MYATNASARWQQLDGQRRGFINRCEKYAAFTIQKLCTPQGYTQNSNELSHDFQAVGAQAVNHLANKIVLALFAPSRPFFRMDPNAALRKELLSLGVDEGKLTELLAQGEKDAIAELDRMSMRPKLYEAIKHLIVTGNALMILTPTGARVVGIKNFVVRRSMTGQVIEIIHADRMLFDELDPEVQDVVGAWSGSDKRPDREVTLYRWIIRGPDGMFSMTQWVDDKQLPQKFNGRWDERSLPYRVLTWDLSDDADYATGLVEDYQGDFAGLSMLSKSQIQGAILASEFRWLVNPAGMTRPEDFENSENGAAIPGAKDDVHLVQSNKSGDLAVGSALAQEYVTRIGRGFLMGSTITRNAERVTAEEIRMQATELETSLGGVYSRLAVDFQIPMAYWLMDLIGFELNGDAVRPSIVTGLEALSRSGDLDDLKLWLNDMAGLNNLPEMLQMKLNMDAIASAFASARRIKVDGFMKSKEQLAADMQQAQEAEAAQAAKMQGIQAAGNIAVNSAKEIPQA